MRIMKRVAAYRPPYRGTQPNHLHRPYVSSIKRDFIARDPWGEMWTRHDVTHKQIKEVLL